ncbi:MFS transporter [Photobacterium carnosum]|uniref:MFS transporter n=1 Tax=Photobacterium carnosum TaxID=2023717 RepID=UPI001E3921EE|nr:MFS transporter [Photobacterium carnosum]MCD9531373.1 MFS transporter [Photobacterium carnosum]MCD9546379.1 MFS transporter [Photobacterium carnosum]MCF2155245.1 MFS transporter [Photobacterium carnosum]MCF2217091.1 MFS transporter [Photobacterium carnosum]
MIETNTLAYKKTSFALALGSFIVFCNLYLFQPMLPLMATEFSVSATQINWVLAAATLMLAVCLIPWAIASEIVGRRMIMVISLLLMPIVGVVMVFAHDLFALTLARGVMGISVAGYIAVAVAYMAEEFSPKALVLAVGGYISANSLGGIAGRLYGGIIGEQLGWHWAVLGMAVMSFIGAVVVIRLLPSQQHFIHHHRRFRIHAYQVIAHIKQPILWLAMLIGGVNFALFVNLYSVTGFRLVAAPFNLPLSWASLIFLCYLSGTITSRLSGRWASRYSPLSGIILGGVLSLSGLWLGLIESRVTILISLLLLSSGAFFTHSLAYAWVSQHAKVAKATATALYLVHYYVGSSLGGFFLIYCWLHGGWDTVVIGGTLLYMVMFVCCGLLIKAKQQSVLPLQLN